MSFLIKVALSSGHPGLLWEITRLVSSILGSGVCCLRSLIQCGAEHPWLLLGVVAFQHLSGSTGHFADVHIGVSGKMTTNFSGEELGLYH